VAGKFQQDTSSDRTPSPRMLPSVIGSIGWSKRDIPAFSLCAMEL
jgi:hypothetical protein